MSTNVPDKSKSATMSPLGMIALFLSLTQIVLGVAATQLSGVMQVALVIFVMAFPTLIAIAFFVILWCKPYVLYPPTEFRGGADVGSFVDAMQRRAVDETRVFGIVKHAISTTLSQRDALMAASPSPELDKANLANKLSEQIIAEVEKATLTVDTRPIAGAQGNVRVIPYDASRPMVEFVNDIYWSLPQQSKMGRYTFGSAWALKDEKTGKVFGTDVPVYQLGWIKPLADFGILAGMKLSVIPLKN
jgi:hypothetical protein